MDEIRTEAPAGKERIGDYLLRTGSVTRRQLDVALGESKVTGERVGESLIRFGFLNRSALTKALAATNPLALIGERNSEVDIPAEVLLRTKTAFLGGDSEIYLATLDPDPQAVVDEISQYVPGRKVSLISVANKTILDALDALREEHRWGGEEAKNNFDDLQGAFQDVVRGALNEGASDIHLDSTGLTFHIRYRLDGILHFVRALPEASAPKLFALIKNLSKMDHGEKRRPQDGSFSVTDLFGSGYRGKHGRHIDFRVACIPTVYGEKITIRILDKERQLVDIRELGITKIDEWLKLAGAGNGIILVCGSTGSGKTTTLYSTLRSMDTISQQVIMLEDPVEYRMPGVNQTQVSRSESIGMDFASILRALVRHDPDIAIIGEIRDNETASNAFRLADTGHLVYATLHTNNVPSTITRLSELGINTGRMSELIKGILVQSLVRKTCQSCGGARCPACRHTGYKGRTLLTEFAVISSPRDFDDLLRRKLEYHSFAQDARIKIEKGITDQSEAERVLGFDIFKSKVGMKAGEK